MATLKSKFGKKSSSKANGGDNVSVGSSTSSSSSISAPLATMDKQPALFARMTKKFAKLTNLGRDDAEIGRRQIEELESRLEESERRGEALERQLEECGRRCEERGVQLDAQSVKIGDLVSQLSGAKEELACRDGEHERRLRVLKEDHGRRVNSLEKLHQTEIDRVKSDHKMADDDLEAKLAQLEAIYKCQIEELSAKCSQAVSGLTQLKESQLVNESLRSHSEDKSVQLNSPLRISGSDAGTAADGPVGGASPDDNRLADEQIEQLRKENEICRQEKQDLEEKNVALNVVIDENRQAIVSLSVQVVDLRDELQIEQQKAEETAAELLSLQESVKTQKDEIDNLNKTVAQLEKENGCHQSTIDQLNAELKDVKAKLENTADQLITNDKKCKQIIEEKDKEFEDMQNLYTKTLDERKAIQEKYDKEFEFLRNCHQDREQQMMEDFEWKLREIQKSSKVKQDELKELQVKLKAEYEDLVNKKDSQAESLSKQIEENDDKINLTETELRQLRGFTEELQKGMRVAASQVDQMRMLEIRFREELRETRSHLVESKDTVSRLQKELNETKASCERRLKAKDANLKKTYDEQIQIINQQWNSKLDKEIKRRAEELEIEYNNHKLSALEELSLQKDQELAALMKKYEIDTTELSKNLAAVNSKLENRERQLTDEIELVKMSVNLKLSEAQKTLQMKTEEQHRKEMELKGREKQIEELQMQLSAHRATLELIKEEAAKQKDIEIQQTLKQHEQQLESTNKSWEEKLSNSLEVQSQSHKMQIHNARIELEKLMQISNQKEQDQLECIVELKEALSQREMSIKRLNEEMQRLQKGLAKMSQELEFHGREILRVRNEASRQLRAASDGTFNHVKHDEDKTAIKQLREAVLDKDRMVKKLQEEKKVLYKQLQNHMSDYKRLSASQPVVNTASPKVNKRHMRSKECPNRLSAPVIMATFDRNAHFIKEEDSQSNK